MTFCDRIKEPNVLICIGMWSLVLGTLSLRFLQRITGMSEDLADGIIGLLYGLSITGMLIGGMLLGVSRNARRRSGTHAGPCS